MARVKDQWRDSRRHGRGKRWLACWIDPDGREKTKAFAKKYDAEQYAAKMEADATRGLYVDPTKARTTVSQWCDVWLKGYATRRKSTLRQAEVHIAKIRGEFGDLPLAAVRPSQVKAWTAKLRENGHEASYVYALHSRLAQIMSDAVHDGMIPRSPCSRRTSPPQGKPRPFVATTDQVWALHDAVPKHLRAAILLGAFVGLRVAEACGLRVEDVDFMRGVVHPRVQYPGEELKTEISRTAIPIPQSLALELSAHVKTRKGKTVLANRRGDQLTPWTLERAMRSARKTINGLPSDFRYHDLRHYLASLLIASGADVKVVQARLRHASAKTTLDTYSHLWPDSDESTRAAIDAVLETRAEQSRSSERTA